MIMHVLTRMTKGIADLDDVVVVDDGMVSDALEQVQEPYQQVVLRQEQQAGQEVDAQEGDSSPADAQDTASSSSEVMEVSLSDAQYANITAYMSTQLYVSLSILIVVALVLGAILAQQVLSRWGVR